MIFFGYFDNEFCLGKISQQNIYNKTPILEYQKMYSKIRVYSKIGEIYEVFKNFGPQQKIHL